MALLPGWREHRSSARQRGYDSKWDKARAGFLRSHPLCSTCYKQGRVTAANVVDHIKPHRGDRALFWDRTNWQPMCTPCHSKHKQRAEMGLTQTVDESGWPA